MNGRSLSSIALALFLIGYGISLFVSITVAPFVLAFLAVAAGVLMLFGR